MASIRRASSPRRTQGTSSRSKVAQLRVVPYAHISGRRIPHQGRLHRVPPYDQTRLFVLVRRPPLDLFLDLET